MRSVPAALVLVLVLALLSLCALAVGAQATRLQSSSSQWIGIIGGARGGKKPVAKYHSRKSSAFDDDDDDDDYESDRISITGKKSSRRSKLPAPKSSKMSSRGKMQLVSWGNRGSNQKKGKGPTLKERLEQLAKHGQSAYKEVYRRAKVLRSSAFEGILLKATWPGSDPVPPELLTEIIKYSIPAFKYSRADDEAEDPYFLTMHKLWTKMWEKDWRTVTKSLYILHCISRDSAADACRQFAVAIKDMSKTRNPKKSDHKYFDLRQISELDDAHEDYHLFVKSYASYVLFRAKTFSNRVMELRDLSPETSEKKAVQWLARAQQLMKLGMQVSVGKGQRNVITGQAVKLVAIDLREVWKVYNDKVAPLLGSGRNYSEPRAEPRDVVAALGFLQEKEAVLKTFLATSAKAFQAVKVKIPGDVPVVAAAHADLVKARMDQLLSVNGGALRVHKAAGPLDDDEWDDDDEEEGQEDEEEEEENEEEGVDEEDDEVDEGHREDVAVDENDGDALARRPKSQRDNCEDDDEEDEDEEDEDEEDEDEEDEGEEGGMEADEDEAEEEEEMPGSCDDEDDEDEDEGDGENEIEEVDEEEEEEEEGDNGEEEDEDEEVDEY